jgi:hypothetical protein
MPPPTRATDRRRCSSGWPSGRKLTGHVGNGLQAPEYATDGAFSLDLVN